jgi:Tfp pilus assembly protein PilE
MHKKNFTLVELMFAVGILVILIGIAWANASKVLTKSTEAQIKAEIRQIDALLSLYVVNKGFLPVKDNKIIAEGLKTESIAIESGYLKDPLDRFYKITVKDKIYTIETSED